MNEAKIKEELWAVINLLVKLRPFLDRIEKDPEGFQALVITAHAAEIKTIQEFINAAGITGQLYMVIGAAVTEALRQTKAEETLAFLQQLHPTEPLPVAGVVGIAKQAKRRNEN